MKYNNFEDLHKLIGKNVYILCYNPDFVITTTKRELDEFLAELDESDMEDILTFQLSNDTFVIYGVVLNIKELPYELSDELKREDYMVFLLGSGLIPEGMDIDDERVDMTPYESIAEVSEEIESMLEFDDSIDKLAVVVGKPVKLRLAVGETVKPIQLEDLYEN